MDTLLLLINFSKCGVATIAVARSKGPLVVLPVPGFTWAGQGCNAALGRAQDPDVEKLQLRCTMTRLMKFHLHSECGILEVSVTLHTHTQEQP